MDIIEYFLNQIGLDKEKSLIIKERILVFALERTMVKLAHRSSEREMDDFKEFIYLENREKEERVKEIFNNPVGKEALLESLMEIFKEILEDEKIVEKKRKKDIITQLQAYILDKSS